MRFSLALSAFLSLSMTAAAAPAFAAGPDAAKRGAAYSTGQIQRIGPDALQRRLTNAKGVSLVDKLKVVARVRKFTEAFYWYHVGKGRRSLAQLRAHFGKLHWQIATLVQDANPKLYADLVQSRAALWQAFADPKLFETGFGRDTIKRIEGRDPQLARERGR